MEADEIYERLQRMSTSADIEDFLEDFDVDWRPLGGRDNNVGIVRSGSAPAQALAERLTNGIDAVLERAVQDAGGELDSPGSPREAVETMYSLSEAGYTEMSSTWVRETGEANLQLLMDEGSDQDHPTLEILDFGIGQRPRDFADTFLSLNEDSKITKPYLIGKYGQGGSNTFDFCEYAIIISRHYQGGDIGWSIVRFNERLDEEEEYSDGVFEYCVIDGEIPSIPEEHADGWAGSRVRLIEYDAADFSNILGPGRGSIYTVTHEAMFGSLFPFVIHDRRTSRFNSEDYNTGGRKRTVVGSRYRLDKSNSVDEDREFKRIDMDDLGTLQVKYWVLEDTDDVDNFIKKTHPIVFTLHGQKHHEEPKRTLKQTNYNFLKDRLIVEVNCEDLSREGKRIFSSTRDRATRGEEYNRVKERLIESLKSDQLLEDLNKKYRQKALNESTDEQEERAKTLLADLLQEPEAAEDGDARADGGQGDGGDGGNGGSGGGGSRDPVEPRHEFPTFVEIDNSPDPLEAKQGRVMRIRLKMDAEDNFDKLDRGEIRIELDGMEDVLTYRSETTLDEGWKVFQYEVDSDSDIGETGGIRAVVEWADGQLEDYRDVEVVEPPKNSGGTKAVLQAPNIIQVGKNDEERRDVLGWSEDDAVVEFMPDEDGPGDVFVAMFNEGIQPIRETLETDNTVRRYDSQYAAYIAYWEMMRVNETEENGMDADDLYIENEKQRTAKMLMRSISEGMNPEALGVI